MGQTGSPGAGAESLLFRRHLINGLKVASTLSAGTPPTSFDVVVVAVVVVVVRSINPKLLLS